MAASVDAATPRGLADLPHYLVVTFAPSDLPSGAGDFQDLSRVIQGLEEILTGMLITDLEEAGESARDGANDIRIVAFVPAEGSYEFIITLAPILDFMVKTLGDSAPVPLDPWRLLAAFMTTAVALEVGTHIADDLYTRERKRLQSLVSLLRDIHDSRIEPISRYMGSRVQVGLNRVKVVIIRPHNLARPITVTPDRKEAGKVALDDDFAKGVKRFSARPVPGPEARAVGLITAWNSRGPYFRLQVARFTRTIQCKHTKALDAIVRQLSQPGQVVAVSGTAYYPAGVVPAPPPLFVRVRSVQPASLGLAPPYEELPPSPMPAGARSQRVPVTLWTDTGPES